MNILLKRTLSGIVFITLVGGSVLLGQYTMLLLMLAVFSVSFREFHMMFKQADTRLYIALMLTGQIFMVCFYMVFSGIMDDRFMPHVTIAILSVLILYVLFSSTSFWELSLMSLGLIWIAGSSIFFIGSGWIRFEGQYDPSMPMILFILIWINDVSAYLFGSKIGRSQLAPAISPGKTWEGFAGGIVLTSLAGWLVYRITGIFSPAFWIPVGAIISLTATAGDLFESKLKREAGVKDSGKVIPGHGGILDRFDSTLFSAPIYFAIISLWNMLS